jgi:predicted ArsR family transcriptional regulator
MTKEQILEALPGTGIEIAKKLDASPGLVNSHLQQLKRAGKIHSPFSEKGARGRPANFWEILPESLTEVVPTDTSVAP